MQLQFFSQYVVFKLVSKISVGICIACAAIVASNTYIGDPIHCNKDDSIDQKMFEAHCWIHGTERIGVGKENEREIQEHFGCVARVS